MELMREKPSIAALRIARSLEPRRGSRAARCCSRQVAMKYPAGDALQQHRPGDSGRQHGGDCGTHRQRQKHAGQPDPALDRSHARRGLSGRRGPARSRSGMAAPPDRIRAARDFPVQRHAGREHRLGRRRRDAKKTSQRAAELAGLGPDIASFPAGYQTMIGERGMTLSGGQKQRVAIARAILRNPRILILDDALSSVDTLTEERILTGLASVMRGRTTILISHRVSTVRRRRPDLRHRARRNRRAGQPRRADRQRRLLRGPVSEAIARRRAGDDLERDQGLFKRFRSMMQSRISAELRSIL